MHGLNQINRIVFFQNNNITVKMLNRSAVIRFVVHVIATAIYVIYVIIPSKHCYDIFVLHSASQTAVTK